MSRHQITPAWQTSRGSIVRASGCVEGVPVAGMRVFGETRQNHMPHANRSVINGVSLSEGSGGELSVSGTATADVYMSLGFTSSLRGGATYSMSCAPEMPDGCYVSVRPYDTIGYVAGTSFLRTSYPSTAKCPGLSGDFNAYEAVLVVPKGIAVSGTYRVMLNEGSEPQPWCPPGLSSVSELGLVCAGKNLLGSTGYHGTTVAGVTATSGDDGSVTVSGTLSGNQAVSLGNLLIGNPLLPGTYTVSDGLEDDLVYVQVNSGSKSSICNSRNQPTGKLGSASDAPYWFVGVMPGFSGSVTLRPQLELGTTVTAYEPPHVTATPQDLEGHELRSLPDGTRDVLTVDGSGAVSVEQATAEIVLDGSQEYGVMAIQEGAPNYKFSATSLGVDISWDGTAADSDTGLACDALPPGVSNNEQYEGEIGISRRAGRSEGLTMCVPESWGTTVEALKSYLAAHPVTVVAALATPQTVPLDPITPPTVPAADATLWAASNVPCDIEATTWTASGAEQGRQQAAMVALAQQVRQQAETVAALAAQSLEA